MPIDSQWFLYTTSFLAYVHNSHFMNLILSGISKPLVELSELYTIQHTEPVNAAVFPFTLSLVMKPKALKIRQQKSMLLDFRIKA